MGIVLLSDCRSSTQRVSNRSAVAYALRAAASAAALAPFAGVALACKMEILSRSILMASHELSPKTFHESSSAFLRAASAFEILPACSQAQAVQLASCATCFLLLLSAANPRISDALSYSLTSSAKRPWAQKSSAILNRLCAMSGWFGSPGFLLRRMASARTIISSIAFASTPASSSVEVGIVTGVEEAPGGPPGAAAVAAAAPAA